MIMGLQLYLLSVEEAHDDDVDVSENPTKRHGRTKKLRREEMLMKENVKFKIGKRGYEKWKVNLLATSFPSTQPRVR